MTSQAWVYVTFSIAIFAAAYQTQAGWLFVMAGIAAGLLAVAWALARANRAHLRLRLLAPAPVWQGEEVELPFVLERARAWGAASIQVMAAPRRPRWWFAWWRDALVPPGWPYATVELPAGGRADGMLRLPAPRRGEFPVPPLVIQSAWPMGLIASIEVIQPEMRYLVFPVAPRLRDVPWLAAVASRHVAATRVEQAHGQLLRGVREYRSGDAWRQIHWRTTARLGHPHVKETEREAGEQLSFWLDMRAAVHDDATVEHMITVATALTSFAREAGRNVRLGCQAAAEPDLTGRVGERALLWLALTQPAATDEAPHGEEGAVLLSPVPVPGWRAWASALVLCPKVPPAGPVDATVVCPVGADLAGALAQARVVA